MADAVGTAVRNQVPASVVQLHAACQQIRDITFDLSTLNAQIRSGQPVSDFGDVLDKRNKKRTDLIAHVETTLTALRKEKTVLQAFCREAKSVASDLLDALDRCSQAPRVQSTLSSAQLLGPFGDEPSFHRLTGYVESIHRTAKQALCNRKQCLAYIGTRYSIYRRQVKHHLDVLFQILYPAVGTGGSIQSQLLKLSCLHQAFDEYASKEANSCHALCTSGTVLRQLLNAQEHQCTTLLGAEEELAGKLAQLQGFESLDANIGQLKQLKKVLRQTKREFGRVRVEMNHAMESSVDASTALVEEYQSARDKYLCKRGEWDQLVAQVSLQVFEHAPERESEVSTLIPGPTTWKLRQEGLVHDNFNINDFDIGFVITEGRHHVYKATINNHSSALKQYHLTEEQFSTFQHEASLLHRLAHPNIMPLLGVHLDIRPLHKWTYLQMPLFTRTLHERLEGSGHITEDETKTIVHGLLSAVLHLHTNRVIHSDIHPTNVFLHEDNGTIEKAVLGDFDVSLDLSSRTFTRRHSATLVGGREDYMAPEVKKSSRMTFKGDIFALGLVIKHVEVKTNWSNGKSAALQALVSSMLADDEEARFDATAAIQSVYLVEPARDVMLLREASVPPYYWVRQNTMGLHGCVLHSADHLKEIIQKRMKDTQHSRLEHSRCGEEHATVTRVFRVENTTSWKHFSEKREAMRQLQTENFPCAIADHEPLAGHEPLDETLNEVHLVRIYVAYERLYISSVFLIAR